MTDHNVITNPEIKIFMRLYPLLIFMTLLFYCCACKNTPPTDRPSLRDELYALVDTVPGTVGIAFISDKGTVTVNNGVKYPMMSVFKFHQALAVAETLEKRGNTLDSILSIHSSELDRNTWSPMLKKYPEGDFNISISELLAYAITQSDNNASNLLFKHILSPGETNDFVKSIARDTTFQIRYSESEMKANHSSSYLNYTSPLAAASLMRQVFEEQLVNGAAQDSIKHYLSIVTTGHDRLGAAVQDADIMIFAHKTGSGYRNEAGELTAHNDVGYFRLKDGRSYALAVFIRDFSGSEAEASSVIANISNCVYNHVRNNPIQQSGLPE